MVAMAVTNVSVRTCFAVNCVIDALLNLFGFKSDIIPVPLVRVYYTLSILKYKSEVKRYTLHLESVLSG